MRYRRTSSFLAHLAAALFVPTFVIGVPVALALRGSPFPSRLPSWSTFVMDIQSHNVPNSFYWKTALFFGWVVWLFLSYDMCAELAYRLRHDQARSFSRLGPLHVLTSKVAAAAFVSIPLGWRQLAAAGVPVQTAAVVQPAHGSEAPSPAPPRSVPADADSQSGDALPTYTVVRYDTLWGIAGRLLGDPLRWEQIWQLNEGRQFGDRVFDDPQLIYPGWSLLLPQDAAGEGVQVPSSAGPSPLPSPDREPPAQSSSPAPNTTTAPSRARRDAPPRRPGARDAESPAAASRSVTSSGHADVLVPAVGVSGSLGALFGFALAKELDRRRRQQHKHRRPARRVPLPTRELASVELAIRPGEDSDLARTVDLGMRLLGRTLSGTKSPPVVLGARVCHDALEFFVKDGPTSPPYPFERTGDCWRLQKTPEMAAVLEEASAHPTVLPALVSVGADQAGTVLLNLEAGGIIAIEGEARATEELICAMAVELATCTWRDSLDLYALGLSDDLDLDRVRRLGSLSELRGPLDAQIVAQRHNLEEANQPSTQQARLVVPDERLCPVVVLSAKPAAPEAIADLAIPEDPARLGVALVVTGGLDSAGWHLVIDEHRQLHIPALGLQVSSNRLAQKTMGAVEALLRLATEERDVGIDEPPYNTVVVSAEAQPPVNGCEAATTEAEGERGEPSSEVLQHPREGEREGSACETPRPARVEEDGEAEEHECLAVLGSVELRGARSATSSRTKVIQLIAWLAFHRQGASAQQIAVNLWRDKDVAQEYVWNVVRHARRLLSPRADGQPRITRWGKLRLDPQLDTDFDHFVDLSRTEDPQMWLEALSLVRGEPFADVDWPWATVEGIVSHVTDEVLDLACRVANWALEHDEGKVAVWAAEQGLLLGETARYDQRLWRLLMRGSARVGGRQALRSVMDRLQAALDDDFDEIDVVEPETEELFDELMRSTERQTRALRSD